ncbi:MAG: hypothetical protein WC878_05640 [Candidatus Paceibacterota bacterium]|jgi:hypothetical protein
MPFKHFTIDFAKLAKESSNRFDVDFSDFNSAEKTATYSFRDYFLIENSEGKNLATSLSESEDDFCYGEIGDVAKDGNVEPQKLNFSQRDEFVENYFKKIEKGDIQQAEENNILISKVRPNLRKFVFVNEEYKNYFFTTAFINIKPKKLHKIFYYCFRTIFYDDLMAISRQGKGYPTLKEDDLLNMRLNKKTIDKLEEKESELVAKIEPIEQKIKEIKVQIIPAQEVMNKVFAREFGFDLERFEELKKIKNYWLDLSAFANNKDIRQSVKFHREAGIFVIEQLQKNTNKKIKHFIAEPIVLGTSVSPSDYDENGDWFYVSMANIKNWKFEREDSKLVSPEYARQNQNKIVAKDDILVARSGEGTIGKVALIEDENLKGVFADFTMRIRLANYNPLFAYYYFRTEYFQYLVEVNKKGLGNNTNIFPSQIQELPMIDISLQRQQKIVDEIKMELDKQEEIKKKVDSERAKIDEIIEKAVR